MKKCRICKQIKQFEEFHTDNQAKDRHYSICKTCRKPIDAVIYKTSNKPDKCKDYRLKRAKIRDEIKSAIGCCFCRDKEPCALDFHHNDRALKVCNISMCSGIPKMLEEIKKCTLLCASCHRKLEKGILKLPQ